MKNLRKLLKGNFIRTAKKKIAQKSIRVTKKGARRVIQKTQVILYKPRLGPIGPELPEMTINLVVPNPKTSVPESPTLDILFKTRSPWIERPTPQPSKKAPPGPQPHETPFYKNPGELYAKKAAIEQYIASESRKKLDLQNYIQKNYPNRST